MERARVELRALAVWDQGLSAQKWQISRGRRLFGVPNSEPECANVQNTKEPLCVSSRTRFAFVEIYLYMCVYVYTCINGKLRCPCVAHKSNGIDHVFTCTPLSFTYDNACMHSPSEAETASRLTWIHAIATKFNQLLGSNHATFDTSVKEKACIFLSLSLSPSTVIWKIYIFQSLFAALQTTNYLLKCMIKIAVYVCTCACIVDDLSKYYISRENLLKRASLIFYLWKKEKSPFFIFISWALYFVIEIIFIYIIWENCFFYTDYNIYHLRDIMD